jgi:glycosyltransferase involved in cell wall biosynthesis
MRIIYYSPHPTHDIVSEVGYSTHQREIIHALKAAGHEVITVIMGGDTISVHSQVLEKKTNPSTLKTLLKKMVPRMIWTSLNNYKLILHDRKAERRLESRIQEHFPDLLYERSEYLQDSGAKMASKYNIRYFLEVNAPFVEEMRHFEGYSLYENKAHKIEKYKLDTASKIFSVSSALSNFLVKQYNCKPEKIILQPNCINLDKLDEKLQDPALLKKKLGIHGEKVIGFVGSIFPYHGVDILISAFAQVHRSKPDIKLLIVGDGSILNDLKRQVATAGIDNYVVFAGKIPHKDVFSYIALMDICVMAKSNWYGSPVKIFEYGLMKKPIIAPDTSPVKDVMIHNESGLITGNSESDLVEAIHQYLEQPAFAETCAMNFHQRVVQEFTWQKAADRIIKECE